MVLQHRAADLRRQRHRGPALRRHPHAGEVLPALAAIITDRDELDKQIKDVFSQAGEAIHRAGSGADLMRQLGQAKPRLLCSLVHKFGRQR